MYPPTPLTGYRLYPPPLPWAGKHTHYLGLCQVGRIQLVRRMHRESLKRSMVEAHTSLLTSLSLGRKGRLSWRFSLALLLLLLLLMLFLVMLDPILVPKPRPGCHGRAHQQLRLLMPGASEGAVPQLLSTRPQVITNQHVVLHYNTDRQTLPRSYWTLVSPILSLPNSCSP